MAAGGIQETQTIWRYDETSEGCQDLWRPSVYLSWLQPGVTLVRVTEDTTEVPPSGTGRVVSLPQLQELQPKAFQPNHRWRLGFFFFFLSKHHQVGRRPSGRSLDVFTSTA